MRELGYFLNIDKPSGVTSRDVVDRVRRVVGTKRVGHAGTLDPMATGVLVVAVERATRLVEYVQAQHKTYFAEFLLGRTSDTDDIEGRIEKVEVASIPDADRVAKALSSFVGSISQRPPAFSAIKISGERAYRLARKGHAVVPAARTVEVHSVELLEYEFPKTRVRIACGSGTYIRSIARDLGEMLRVGGVMSELRRTAIGVFDESSAIGLDELTQQSVMGARRTLGNAVAELARLVVSREVQARFLLGQKSPFPGRLPLSNVAVFAENGLLLGVGIIMDGVLRPVKGGFVESQGEGRSAAKH